MTRREWLKAAATVSGAALLPNVTGILAPAAQAHAPLAAGGGPPLRERLLADFGWRFHLGHANDPAQDFNYGRGSGAFAKSGSLIAGGRGNPSPTQATFDDRQWAAVNLPHDWAIDLPFVNDPALIGHGSKPLGRAYPETSIGWYRRTFTIPASDAGRRIALEFDGVFRDAMIILNGHFIGRNLSGYAPFRFDVTDLLTYGSGNVLVVRVDATEGEGWFYEGAGIYRHVWLVKTAPVHVAPWGTFVTAAVHAGSSTGTGSATVTVATDVMNAGDQAAACHAISTIRDAAGRTIASAASALLSIAGWQQHALTQQIAVPKPRLWSLADPHLYHLVTTIEGAAGTVDRYETPFGIRTVHFDADRGFFLNGQRVEIKGTCNHQDHAGVGAALPDRLQAYRVERLQAMGSNAYRTSHNPPTPELLDACDRLGMLVLDETRMMSSTEEGLSELDRMIRRDRNHPSVFCWSIGNEEPEQATDRGVRIATSMKRLVRALDPTRLTTEAMNNNWGKGLSAVVDVQGFNYHTGPAPEMDAFHTQFPKQPTLGTETASTVSTRGIYENDPVKGYVSAYDRNFPPWASTAETWWKLYAARPWVAGGFAWTGFDYRGEPTPYDRSPSPCISSHFGILDTCGFPKDNFYYYQAWWTDAPVLHLFPHWNWAGKDGQPIEVWCHSNLDSVELFLNGRSLGAQTVARYSHVAWNVPYAPGALEARGLRNGQLVLTATRETTGPAAAIRLRADRDSIAADGEDVSVIEVQVVDGRGRLVPTADQAITFHVAGSGRILGVGNGDPSSHESDKADSRRAFGGLCMAIVQSTFEAGEILVEASSPGLDGATMVIRAAPVTRRPPLA